MRRGGFNIDDMQDLIEWLYQLLLVRKDLVFFILPLLETVSA